MGDYGDKYIRRSTRGLSDAVRLERAAELRTHLLERTNKLVLEGFAPEEAEFLAVERIGGMPPSFKVKREILLPIILLSLLTSVYYLYVSEGFPMSNLNYSDASLDPYLSAYQSDSDDAGNLVDGQNLSLRLPEAAQSVSVKVVGASDVRDTLTLPTNFVKTGIFHKAKFMDVSYVINPRSGTFDINMFSSGKLETLKIKRPEDREGVGFLFEPEAYAMKMTPETVPSLPLDRWTPIAVFNVDQTENLTNEGSILYFYANSSAQEPPANKPETHDELTEIFDRHIALNYGATVGFRLPN